MRGEEDKGWRSCENPCCQGKLSPLVPREVVLCTPCQIKLADLKSFYRHRALSEKDLRFILYHQNGCNLSQLASVLGIPYGTLFHYVSKGAIKGVKKQNGQGKASWHIDYNEMVRVIETEREWIPAVSLVDQGVVQSVHRATFREYVKLGYFGAWRRHFSGTILIHKSYLPEIKQRCLLIRKMQERRKKLPYRYIKPGELTPRLIAQKLNVSLAMVYYWLKKYQIKVIRRKNRLIITPKAFAFLLQCLFSP